MFKLKSNYEPSGDQPAAIKKLLSERPGKSTLMGVTGSGKTFTVANVIAAQNKPVLILSPNKTLAAQLYEEFSAFFPENKVCYFVSYYDYYQPESYMPAQDIYVPKETKVNSELERLRIEATASIINRSDTIVVSSVSCIYSIGNPHDYRSLAFSLKIGQRIKRSELLHKLVFIQYNRNDIEHTPGSFSVMGDSINIYIPYQKEVLRIIMFGDVIQELYFIDKINNNILMALDNILIFPAKHFVTTKEKKEAAIKSIKAELDSYASKIYNPIYKERLLSRVNNDLEMIENRGFCNGIENYSSHFDGRSTGEPPYSLLDFFDKDFLLIIDESHIAIPQLKGMYAGDRSRKQALIEYGFRLPSAFDNRPLKFEEIERYFSNAIFVSATPGQYELAHTQSVTEQIIRPTGLVDPIVEIHPRIGQLDHLLEQIKELKSKDYRALVTVLTKKLAEDLSYYLQEKGIKVCYLHSEIKTPDRTEILHKLRTGIFDCVVGVNLLREGLDLPEVALVAIMDADVESFLRDKRSLIQIIGRAARNIDAKVILYMDNLTSSVREAMAETQRRRELQILYNEEHNITPKSAIRIVTKSISSLQEAIREASKVTKKGVASQARHMAKTMSIEELEAQMKIAAQNFDFELAINLRDQILRLKKDK